MAKKRVTRKPKGSDDSGRVIDLSDPYVFPGTHRTKDSPPTYKGPMAQGAKAPRQGQIDPNRAATGRAYETYQQYRGSTNRYERQESARALRNMKDLAKNVNAASASGQKGPFALGPAKSPISGRTVEFGTRSMLQGLRNWIAGGGGSRLTGR